MKKDNRINARHIPFKLYALLFILLSAFNGFHMWIYLTLEKQGVLATHIGINLLMFFVMFTAAILTTIFGFFREQTLSRPLKKLGDVYGLRIIERIETESGESELLKYAKIFALTHHEKWDGSGYPNNLSGEKIPLQGRIMAVADVYDALISDRPYKKAMTHEEAIKIISEGKGTHFDPVLIDLFLGIEPIRFFI